MLWTHHDEVVTPADPNSGSHDVGRTVLKHLSSREPVDRIVIEGHLGSAAVPKVMSTWSADYYRAWLHGHPVLLMTSGPDGRVESTVDVWFSPAARGAWRHHVEHDSSVPAPRKRAKVYETGDPLTPYVILGVRIRRWNAAQDLPKPLIGATAGDPDGAVFLSDLGQRRWKPIAQALVAELVKEALRPVPETTKTTRYQATTLGEGQMIRYGRNGPVWVDAEAAVHLAGLAGYALGYPDEIPHPLGGEGWSRLADIFAKDDPGASLDVSGELQTTETVSYSVFAAEIGPVELKRTFPEYRWGRGGPQGERLRDDDTAVYARMLYRGHPAMAAIIGERSEYWLSSSAQAKLIDVRARTMDEAVEPAASDNLVTPVCAKDPQVEAAVAPIPAPKPVKLRKRQRKAVAKLARAIERLGEEGMSLVLQGGVLKAKVDDESMKREGLVTVFPEAAVIPSVD